MTSCQLSAPATELALETDRKPSPIRLRFFTTYCWEEAVCEVDLSHGLVGVGGCSLGVVKLRLELVCLQLFLFPRKGGSIRVLKQQLELVLMQLGSAFYVLGAGR